MKVSSQHLRLDTQNKTAELQGYKGGARQLLREMAADLVGTDGRIRSGYLRLSESDSQVTIRAGHLGSGATAATGLIKDLVRQAYGEQASQALEAYLNGKRSHNKVGTQSFVKLIQALEADVGEFRTNHIDTALKQAMVSSRAGLKTESIASLKLPPDVSALLATNLMHTPYRNELPVNWKRGLELLFPDSEVTPLGSGGEGFTFGIKDAQGAERVYKGQNYAGDLAYVGAREQDVGAIYSSRLRQSPHLLTPSHFLMGFGGEENKPQTLMRVPADRVKELAKEANLARGEPKRWLIYGLEMPKAAGRPLDAQASTLTLQDVGQIAKGLHAALSDLAAHHAIHCDIKPENLMYNPADGQTQVIDFGGLQKLSKHDAAQGQKPQATRTIAKTPGFTPPWIDSMKSFGVERDRYAAAMTLLSSVWSHPKDDEGKDATASKVIFQAFGDYQRAADRPDAVLDDLLSRLSQQNPAMHQQLDSQLQHNPRFRDYLSTMFASSVPGPQGDALWEQLKDHPFVSPTPLSRAMDAAGLSTPEAARARADRTLSFFRTASEKDFRDLNDISGSALVWAVHTDASVADTRLPMAQREQRFRELEALYHQQRPAVQRVRDPAEETEEEFAQSLQDNLKAEAESRANSLTKDLAILSNPDQCGLLQRTVVPAKQAGLTANQVDILGRGTNLRELASVPDQRVDELIARTVAGSALNRDDMRLTRMLFPEINEVLSARQN